MVIADRREPKDRGGPLIARVDGWLYGIPDGAAFLQFSSGDREAGNLTAFDASGEVIECEPMRKTEELHWTAHFKHDPPDDK